ncbi:glycoside hydrolase domain-containing protein [Paenibacillus kribbensis]|uniref:glycoside hydrolase domain-containing protein n=1 Tax=Paenibacillus kribbensis TaxID=172713 RepID=UPI000A0492D4|nr:glycoside hydrolase domain-containing protein [Paenibacillus kribbensis]
MDEMVLKVQQWVNKTYQGRSGFNSITEDGRTGRGTIRALIWGLQIELGISSPTGSFGPATASLCPTLSVNSDSTNGSVSNQIRILQGALFCKGYNPGGFTGTFGNGTKTAISKLQSDAGLAVPDGIATPMIFKALLNMDAFVNIGDPKIREIQQRLNRDYYRTLFEPLGLIPCDGIYARSTNKALIYALQVEEGIPEPNGSFGPSTTSLCPTLSLGSTQTKFVSLLQYALYFNEYDPGRFDGVFDQGVKTAVTNFQKFTKLTADGAAGKQTWASLLVSTGDKNRKGTACDCITTITPARAQTLKNNGYTTVGRYIVETSKLSKKIKEGELDTIFAAGLSVFPIFQYSANSLSYFSATQGAIDARRALVAANNYGFEPGTIIYFAVDYDAVDGEVTSHLLPHFQALHNKMEGLGGKYRIGIYGPRNVCSRVSKAGYAVTSFVSDMSTGFSGNLGYNLPANWAFDQISTIKIGTEDGAIEIDNNIQSGRDMGVKKVSVPTSIPLDDSYFLAEYRDAMTEAQIKLADEQLTAVQKAKSLRSPAKALSIVLEHDSLITNLSRIYSIRKALIQCVLMRELCTEGADDTVADGLVIQYYGYKKSYEAWDALPTAVKIITPAPTPPLVIKEDASTGLGQIFAATAIDSINFAVGIGIVTDRVYDIDNWKDMDYIWDKLHTDNNFNVSTCALVLIRAANKVGLSRDYYEFGEAETKSVITRYNGTGDSAVNYGNLVYQTYLLFEKYNKIIREQAVE